MDSTPRTSDGSDPPAHRWRWIVAAVAALTLLIGVAVTTPWRDDGSSILDGGLAPGGDPVVAPPVPNPADLLLAPGYDPHPGPFTLPEADPNQGMVKASLRLQGGAVQTDGLVGLSFESTDLASPVWGSEASNIDEMLGAMEKPVLRFGGNSVDRRMWWTSRGEPAPDWADATVTPEDLERVAQEAEAADATVSLVLDLGHDNPDRAADMAAHAQQAFGARLVGVTIGNEPNGFHHPNQPQLAVREEGWGPEGYQASLTEYSAALEERTPGLPIVGPGAYDATWLRAFSESGIPGQSALSMHWYPLWNCDGPASSPANPTVEDLASPRLRDRAEQIIGLGAEVAAKSDLPLWIEETGPTSCPGTNDTSRTHAQALWTVDYSLTAAEVGASRIAFHSTLAACRGGAPMSPVCGLGEHGTPGEVLGGRTSYLSLLQLGQIPPGRVLTPTVSGDGSIAVHGVIAEDGTLSIIVVDLRDPAEGMGAAPVRVSAPDLGPDRPTSWSPARGSRLEGSALDASSSSLGALAPVDDEIGGRSLTDERPLTVTSTPGSTTLLVLAPTIQDTSP